MIQPAALALILLPPVQAAALSDKVGEAAVATSLAACERWLLEPASWANDIGTFGQAEGLQPQSSVPDAALPPVAFRAALHHWRVPLGEGGIYVTTSDRLPMCHLSGGGPFDLQPATAQTLSSGAFAKRWKRIDTRRRGDMVSTRFVSVEDSALTLTVSHAETANARTDRVQFLATAQYQPGR